MKGHRFTWSPKEMTIRDASCGWLGGALEGVKWVGEDVTSRPLYTVIFHSVDWEGDGKFGIGYDRGCEQETDNSEVQC